MPLYEYECDVCGHRFEVIQKFSDAPKEECPVCGGAVHKLQSAPAFQFKGSGWYVTDYAKRDQPREGRADGKGEEKADGGPPDDSAKSAKPEKPGKHDKTDSGDKTDRTAKSDASEKSTSSKPASSGDSTGSTPQKNS